MQQQQPVFSRSAFPLLFQRKERLLSVLLLSFSIPLILLVARQRQETTPYAAAPGVQHYEDVLPDGNLYVYDMDHGGPGPHNTVVSLNGVHVYMGSRNFSTSPTYLTVADTATNANVRKIGPFKEGVRPFTINSSETLAYVTTTQVLGFHVASITNGHVLYTVDLTQLGFPNSPTGPSGPSHGIALSPDEKTLAAIDWPNDYDHLFSVTGVPSSAPHKTADLKFTRSTHHTEAGCAYDCLTDGWLEYSRDGRFLYVGDVGDVIFVAPIV